MWFLLVSQSLIASCSVLVRRSRCVRRGTERDRVGRPGTQLLGWSWDRQPVFRYCLRASQDDLRCGHLVRLGTIVEGSPEFGIEAHWHGSGSGGAHWGAAWPPAQFRHVQSSLGLLAHSFENIRRQLNPRLGTPMGLLLVRHHHQPRITGPRRCASSASHGSLLLCRHRVAPSRSRGNFRPGRVRGRAPCPHHLQPRPWRGRCRVRYR